MDEESLELKLSLLDEYQSACTHCGICSESCLTFQEMGWEHSSPRGRIRLAKDFLNGKIQPDSSALTTFDQCLGCNSCEVSCPYSVPYHKIRQTVQELRVDLRRDCSPSAKHYRNKSKLAYRIGNVFWRSFGLWLLIRQDPFLKGSKGRFKKKIKQKKFDKAITLMVSCTQDLFNHELIEEAILFINRLGYKALIDNYQPCCGAILEKCAQAGEEAIGLNAVKQRVMDWQKNRVKTFFNWLPKETYFLSQSCQSFLESQLKNQHSKRQVNDLYIWILEKIIERNISLAIDPCVVYYQPYCRQAEKGEKDSVLQLFQRIEGLTIRLVPLSKACCGGCGNEVMDGFEAKLWGQSKWLKLPQGALVAITSPACWKHLTTFAEKNIQIVYPIQLLFRVRLTVDFLHN